jgi:hypothetical protein
MGLFVSALVSDFHPLTGAAIANTPLAQGIAYLLISYVDFGLPKLTTRLGTLGNICV